MRRRGFLLRSLFLALAVSAVFVLTSVQLHAQADTGSIQGTIKDQSGAVIPGAKVTLTNEGTNLAVTMNSRGDGTYTFSPVKIGNYAVSAEAQGFAKAVQAHITLELQQALVVDLTLKPGAVTQVIEVTGAPPALQTQDASVGQVIDARAVNDLPLNGRNFTFLAQVAAGVNTPEADTRGNAASGAFSANGLRPGQNNYLLNGIDNNSNAVDFLNGTNYAVLPPLDAIQEFKVQTDDYSAQFGRAGGAILNATIKSGSNKLHGNAWEYIRNDHLDAADFFEDSGGIHKGRYQQNQFGATLGGPILKNKAFFFGDYEGLRVRQGTVYGTNSVPTALERSSDYQDLSDIIRLSSGAADKDILGRTAPYGTIWDPATTRPVVAGGVDPVSGLSVPTSALVPAGTGEYVRDPFGTCPASTLNFTLAACGLNHIPAGRTDANAVKILNLFPMPTNGNLSANNATNPLSTQRRDAFDVRVDINRGDKDQIFAAVSYVDYPEYLAGPFGGIVDGGSFTQGNQTAKTILPALSWTHTLSPSTVNEARIGMSRLHTTRMGPVSSQMGLPGQYGIAGIPQFAENGGLPAFAFNGLSTLGSNNFLPSDEISQTTQVTDNFTKIYGKHTFKMGMEYQRVKFSTLQPPWSHGQYGFDSNYTRAPNSGETDPTGIAQFLLTPIASTLPEGDGGIDYNGGSDSILTSNAAVTDDGRDYWGGYGEDTWKVTPKLTVNLGLRWEYFGQVFEHHGAQANFIPGPPNGGAEYLFPSRDKGKVNESAGFLADLATDGIALDYTDNNGLGNSQKTNFGPRIGFAYQVTPKFVMRGGYGLFYNGFENRGYSPNLGENYPFQFGITYSAFAGDQNAVQATQVNGKPMYPALAGTPCATDFPFEAGFSCTSFDPSAGTTGEGVGLEGIQHNYITPYMEGWNLTLQYELTPSMTAQVAYVGNASHHQEVFPNNNNPENITFPGVAGNYPYPDMGHGASYDTTQGNSFYDGLQTQLEKHYASGLNFLAAYTWAHARSDARGPLNFGSTLVNYRAATLAGWGIQKDYSDSPQDIRNVFHFSGGYELPFGPGKKYLTNATGAEKQVLGGWSAQWNLTLEGGQPITVGCAGSTTQNFGCTAYMISGQKLHGSGGVNQFLNPAAFTQPCVPNGTGGPTGCVPETGLGLLGGENGQVSGPSLNRLDFSVFKNFQITERFKAQFRSEFFNLTNHPTFNAPGFGGNGVVAINNSLNFTSSNFGEIGSTRFPGADSRQIQFALKLFF
ncbi:MAG: TonB-dependent receptor [Terriglobia bacterium]